MVIRTPAIVHRLSLVAILCLGALLTACTPDRKYCEQCSACGAFLEMGRRQQVEEIVKLPPESQLDVYLCVITYRRALPDYLAYPLAQEGGRVLPNVVNRITQSQDMHAQHLLFRIVELMVQEGYYDLAHDEGAMKVLRDCAQTMDKDGERHLIWLEGIKRDTNEK